MLFDSSNTQKYILFETLNIIFLFAILMCERKKLVDQKRNMIMN